MKKKIGVLFLFSILFFICNAEADAIWTSGHYIIDVNNIYDGAVAMYNDSSADMYGGYMHYISANDTTIINLHDGHITELKLWDNSTATILGGEITALDATGSAIINFYDGLITNGLTLKSNSIANIYGGQISGIYASSNSIVNLYAYDVVLDTSTYILTGRYYSDNSSFTLNVQGQSVYTHINIIPEPATLMLLLLGGAGLRKK